MADFRSRYLKKVGITKRADGESGRDSALGADASAPGAELEFEADNGADVVVAAHESRPAVRTRAADDFRLAYIQKLTASRSFLPQLSRPKAAQTVTIFDWCVPLRPRAAGGGGARATLRDDSQTGCIFDGKRRGMARATGMRGGCCDGPGKEKNAYTHFCCSALPSVHRSDAHPIHKCPRRASPCRFPLVPPRAALPTALAQGRHADGDDAH